ncbi:hypothetical protein ACPV54_25505, partial [Vibrio mediterranei]
KREKRQDQVIGINRNERSQSPKYAFDFENGPGEEVIITEVPHIDNMKKEDALELVKQYKEASQIRTREVDGNYLYSGVFEKPSNESSQFKLSFNESLVTGGTSHFELDGNKAILTGELGTRTYLQLRDITVKHPEIDTVVIKAVNGSINDDINMHTGNLLRNSGLNTEIPENGYAYSGGVDLFSAGVLRDVKQGGVVGVHSWCCSVNGKTADKLSKNDPAHHDQITYFKKMLGESNGPEFYFFTINSAPFNGIYKMTRKELNKYHLLNSSK